MNAIYCARIDRVYFGASLEDTSEIGFDDSFQYEDFKLSWEQRQNIQVVPNFEREACLAAYRAWQNKKDRHPY
jgi:tRNA(Arg) A34 adenosine deaminase TadA